jgi:hypothetical protein
MLTAADELLRLFSELEGVEEEFDKKESRLSGLVLTKFVAASPIRPQVPPSDSEVRQELEIRQQADAARSALDSLRERVVAAARKCVLVADGWLDWAPVMTFVTSWNHRLAAEAKGRAMMLSDLGDDRTALADLDPPPGLDISQWPNLADVAVSKGVARWVAKAAADSGQFGPVYRRGARDRVVDPARADAWTPPVPKRAKRPQGEAAMNDVAEARERARSNGQKRPPNPRVTLYQCPKCKIEFQDEPGDRAPSVCPECHVDLKVK